MYAKKTLSILTVGTLFAVAAPAMADPPRFAPAHGYRAHERTVVTKHYYHQPVVREVIVHRPVVRRTVVVERPVYVAPRRAHYHGQPSYHAPVYAAPVHHGHSHDSALGTVGGAVIGAVIGSQVGTPESRPVATAVGAVIGAVVGSNF
jgi:uncharacterized protein YcfJ